MVVSRYDNSAVVNSLDMTTMSFWVQMHDIPLCFRLCLVRVKAFLENIPFFGNAIFRKGKCFHVFGYISKKFPKNIFWCLEKKKKKKNPEKRSTRFNGAVLDWVRRSTGFDGAVLDWRRRSTGFNGAVLDWVQRRGTRLASTLDRVRRRGALRDREQH